MLLYPIVDQRPQYERVDGADRCAEDDDRKKYGEDPLVGNGEGQHAPCRTLPDTMLQEGAVLSQGPHAGPSTAPSGAPHAVAHGHAHMEGLPGKAR